MTAQTKKRALPARQKRFVDEYIKDLCAKDAAIRAGYSLKSSECIGYQLLQKTPVKEAIAKALESRAARTKVDADYVLNRLAEIDQLDVLDILDNTGSLLPIVSWPKAWRQTISGLDIQELMSGDVETVVRKIKMPDKLKNLELIGRHVDVSAFRDRVEVEVKFSLADRMAKARERAARD